MTVAIAATDFVDISTAVASGINNNKFAIQFPSDRFSVEVDRGIISRSSTDRVRLTVERVERLVPETG